ncbi:MAG: ribosome-recycling factor [Candidatus Moeniiplasma glomeromycotorum]|nr:ribosome-recycling factor [Candidatus Moeniiplasma glomeromycotorum]MCE8167358.1 ribosome-recycling factor [Candidatus Moeniiplasma glomeromycotorum]MCE8168629.1 ribosome-recycling factor [Candidatus Moeniiplasma glomeromycotorum]
MNSNSWEEIKQKNLKNFEKELSVFAGKLGKIRGNRVNLEAVRELILNYKGENKPIKTVANLRISPQTELVITNFESKLYSLIKKTILENRSEYRLAEKSTSTELYFTLALMTKEIREKLIKEVNSIANAGNIELRKVRENFRKEIKKEKKFSQDQTKNYEKQIDELTKEYEKKLTLLVEKKIKELNS